jgi:hypothetical protein
MALFRVWLGNTGPFSYRSDDAYPQDGTAMEGLRIEGQGIVETAPTLPFHIVRKADLDAVAAEIASSEGNGTSTAGLYANIPDEGGPGDFYYAYDTGIMYAWNVTTEQWEQTATWNGILTGSYAARPAAQYYGRYYWAGDVNYLFFDNGIQWITMNGVGFGVLASRPAATPNVFYFATDNTTLYYSNGSTWAAIGGDNITNRVGELLSGFNDTSIAIAATAINNVLTASTNTVQGFKVPVASKLIGYSYHLEITATTLASSFFECGYILNGTYVSFDLFNAQAVGQAYAYDRSYSVSLAAGDVLTPAVKAASGTGSITIRNVAWALEIRPD